jgi:hypothetical protein
VALEAAHFPLIMPGLCCSGATLAWLIAPRQEHLQPVQLSVMVYPATVEPRRGRPCQSGGYARNSDGSPAHAAPLRALGLVLAAGQQLTNPVRARLARAADRLGPFMTE